MLSALLLDATPASMTEYMANFTGAIMVIGGGGLITTLGIFVYLGRLLERLDANAKTLADHESRIRTVERSIPDGEAHHGGPYRDPGHA